MFLVSGYTVYTATTAQGQTMLGWKSKLFDHTHCIIWKSCIINLSNGIIMWCEKEKKSFVESLFARLIGNVWLIICNRSQQQSYSRRVVLMRNIARNQCDEMRVILSQERSWVTSQSVFMTYMRVSRNSSHRAIRSDRGKQPPGGRYRKSIGSPSVDLRGRLCDCAIQHSKQGD